VTSEDAELAAATFAWEEGLARLAASTGPLGRSRRRIVAAVEQELRRRVGTEFTRRELARAYEDASSWYLDLAAAVAPREPAAWDPAVALDAAFGAYARRAQDAARP
jgi:hypothetical protein